jgi:N-acetylmuramoyl-L-alanine amidase
MNPSFPLRALPILLSGLLALAQPSAPEAAPARSRGRLLVYLDPGHGGEDQGARGSRGLEEKNAALELAQALALQLAGSGMEVRFTRTSDVFIPLWDRARLANEAGADLFISLHLNASRARQAKGSEVYFLTLGSGDRDEEAIAAEENAGAGPGAESASDNVVAGILEDLAQKAYLRDSERLAVAIQAELNLLGGIKQRGVKQAPFVVLRGAAMPAVLVETAFISNPKEEEKLKSPAFRLKVAQAITQGVRRFFADAVGTSRRKAMAASR